MDAEHSRRWYKTEEKLEKAALDLMQTENLDRITVRAVCEAAGVNRTTFYDHFLDVYDLASRLEKKMQAGMLGHFNWGESKPFSREFFLPFLVHIRKNQEFYRIILRPRNTTPQKEGYQPLLDYIRPLCQKAGIAKDEEIAYCLMWFMGGLHMCMLHWVEGGCKETPEEMADLLQSVLPPALAEEIPGTSC